MFHVSKSLVCIIMAAIFTTTVGMLIPSLADIISVILLIPLFILGIGLSLVLTACFLPPVWIFTAWYLFKKK